MTSMRCTRAASSDGAPQRSDADDHGACARVGCLVALARTAPLENDGAHGGIFRRSPGESGIAGGQKLEFVHIDTRHAQRAEFWIQPDKAAVINFLAAIAAIAAFGVFANDEDEQLVEQALAEKGGGCVEQFSD